MNGHERFRQRLGEISIQPISEQDAADGFHNLSGFMSVLIRVNEREQIIPTNQKAPNDENR